jgi:hypothetical protein
MALKALNHESKTGRSGCCVRLAFLVIDFRASSNKFGDAAIPYPLRTFPNRFLPQQELARIMHGCDKLRGQPHLCVF